MPESTNLFIWYHADAELAPELHTWLAMLATRFGLHGRLYMRRNERQTTFMEVFEGVPADAATRIEALAASQAWHARLESARRCESFNLLEPQ
jgi:hypothetical protein